MISIGQIALISMISHLFFIYLTWKVIISLNIEPFVRKGNVKEAKVFLVLITIAVGTGVSRFFLDFLRWSQDLLYLF